MRAIIQHTFGSPDVLEQTTMDAPVPVPTEVLVSVRAAGLNPIDAAIRSGAFPMLGQPPFVLGWDLSGVVATVVPGVNRFQVGDEVYGMPLFPRPAGAYAEFAAAPSRQLAHKPVTVDHVRAAALPLAGLTAWQSLVDVADVRVNQRVLIHATGGGVGHVAVQIAKSLGAYVIATASTDKQEFVRGLGVDLVIDYQRTDFGTVVRDVDVVLELVGRDYGVRSIEVIRPGGLLVTAVERSNAELAAKVRAAGRRFAGITVEPDGRQLEQLAALVDAGRLRVHVDQSFPLARAAHAHRGSFTEQ